MKRVFIIHGYGAKPSDNWFGWLKEELEKKGFEVTVPQMPDTDSPTLQKSLPFLQKLVAKCGENDFFVGHSLGTITILKFLEALPDGEKAGGAVLVGGFSEAIGFEKLSSFTEKPLDCEKVKKSVGKIIAIHSTDDRSVPYKFGEIIRDKLGAELITMHGAGHINHQKGFFKLPEALEAIQKIESRK
ncbi:MAG: alpha/beta hydrolase [Patescibacteria group bacterium]